MNRHQKHKVKRHQWIDGVLHATEHFFESLEEAMQYALHSSGHSAKVYNENDQLIHQVSNQPTDTYA